MLFYKVIKVVFMDICQRSSSSDTIDNTFLN